MAAKKRAGCGMANRNAEKKEWVFIQSGKVLIFFIYFFYYAVAGVSHQQHEFSGWIKISNSLPYFFS